MNASIIGIPRPAPAAPPTAAMSSTCVPGLGADAMDHPDAERGPRAVRAHLERLDVVVAVEPAPGAGASRSGSSRRPASSGSGAGTRSRSACTGRARRRPTSRGPRASGRRPGPGSGRPSRAGAPRTAARRARGRARPSRARAHTGSRGGSPGAARGPNLAGSDGGHRRSDRPRAWRCRGRGRARASRCGPPWPWWCPATRRARCWSPWAAGARVGRRRRAGDVGDRRDVVPVDAVPHPEQQAGHEDPDRGGIEQGRDGGLHGTDLRERVYRTDSRPDDATDCIYAPRRPSVRITAASGDAARRATLAACPRAAPAGRS